MNWNDLQYLLAISRHGSIRKAAKSLHLNHATLSRHMSELSAGLGVRLLEKHGTRVVLSAAGGELLETLKEVDAKIMDACRRLEGRDAGLTGDVRVATSASMARVLFPRLAEFSARYEGIRLHISTGLDMAGVSLWIMKKPCWHSCALEVAWAFCPWRWQPNPFRYVG